MLKITKKENRNTRRNVGFYLDEEHNEAMLAAAEHFDCSRNEVLRSLIDTGLKEFLGKKPKNIKTAWQQYEG